MHGDVRKHEREVSGSDEGRNAPNIPLRRALYE